MGQVSVMITVDGEGKPIGAVIVDRELEGVRPALELQAAVRTLLDIDGSRVRVIGRQDSYRGGME